MYSILYLIQSSQCPRSRPVIWDHLGISEGEELGNLQLMAPYGVTVEPRLSRGPATAVANIGSRPSHKGHMLALGRTVSLCSCLLEIAHS